MPPPGNENKMNVNMPGVWGVLLKIHLSIGLFGLGLVVALQVWLVEKSQQHDKLIGQHAEWIESRQSYPQDVTDLQRRILEQAESKIHAQVSAQRLAIEALTRQISELSGRVAVLADRMERK